jgi:hypothetical protein
MTRRDQLTWTVWSLLGTPWAVSMDDSLHVDTWFVAFSLWGMDGRGNVRTRKDTAAE